MTGHKVIVAHDRNQGWIARCTDFRCGWRHTGAVSKAGAQTLADGHKVATT